jgi:hypothetical protein
LVIFRGSQQSDPVFFDYAASNISSIYLDKQPNTEFPTDIILPSNRFEQCEVQCMITAGGRILIVGQNFGSQGAVKLRKYDGSDIVLKTTSTASDGTNGGFYNNSMIAAVVLAGDGQKNFIYNEVGGQISNFVTFGYLPPAVFRISLRGDAPTAGMDIDIAGNNFGVRPVVKVGDRICVLVSFQATSIKCTLPEGLGRNYRLFVYAGDQSTLYQPQSFIVNYAPPILAYLTAQYEFSTKGGYQVTLIGTFSLLKDTFENPPTLS